MKYAPLAVGLLFCLSASPVVSLGDVHLLFSRHLRRSAGSSHASADWGCPAHKIACLQNLS
jgi:hypothetical protein